MIAAANIVTIGGRGLDKISTPYNLSVIDNILYTIELLSPPMSMIAKLLYYGPSIGLNEVLSLDVSDVNLKKGIVTFSRFGVAYDTVIMKELSVFLGSRKNGPVFLGRQKKTLNPATFFRHLRSISRGSVSVADLSVGRYIKHPIGWQYMTKLPSLNAAYEPSSQRA